MDMRQLLKIVEASESKLDRSIFVYLDPKAEKQDQFAQCSTCTMFMPESEKCGIFSESDSVKATGSCNLYVYGTPSEDMTPSGAVTPQEASYIETAVRCENCLWFSKNECGLFVKLNNILPDNFDLDTMIHPKGCCNAFQSK